MFFFCLLLKLKKSELELFTFVPTLSRMCFDHVTLFSRARKIAGQTELFSCKETIQLRNVYEFYFKS